MCEWFRRSGTVETRPRCLPDQERKMVEMLTRRDSMKQVLLETEESVAASTGNRDDADDSLCLNAPNQVNAACVRKHARKQCPAIVWLPKYGDAWAANLLGDVAAGVLVGILAINHALAYSPLGKVRLVVRAWFVWLVFVCCVSRLENNV